MLPTTVPSRSTSYAVTPTASLDARHVTVTAVPSARAATPDGVVGAVVSTWHGGTVSSSVSLACDTLPAASRALT